MLKAWKDLVVRRDGGDLGSLHDCQVWDEQTKLRGERKVDGRSDTAGEANAV